MFESYSTICLEFSKVFAMPPVCKHFRLIRSVLLQAALLFTDMTMVFTGEKWKHLGPAQRTLYRHVILENYSHFISVGEQTWPCHCLKNAILFVHDCYIYHMCHILFY
uniref:KRAB domain-containing protein n=2 Tax=Ailuropoda melanoleuca TaxID=9646 RepID=A0A7N5JZW5_AILME